MDNTFLHNETESCLNSLMVELSQTPITEDWWNGASDLEKQYFGQIAYGYIYGTLEKIYTPQHDH